MNVPNDRPNEGSATDRLMAGVAQTSTDVARRFAELPVPIACVWTRFAEETHGTAALLRLIDCFEAALKFISMLSLESYRAHVHGREAEILKARLSADLQTPSLGHFAACLRDCSAGVVEQKVPGWSSYLAPIASPATQGAIERLLSLRNKQRGHGATLDSAPARQLVDDYLPTLIVFLAAIPVHFALRFQCTLEGKIFQPVESGAPVKNERPAEPPPAELLEEPCRLLVEHPGTGSWLSFGPLLLVEKSTPDADWSFLFYNGSKGGVDFLDYRTGGQRHFPADDTRALAVARAYPRSQAGSEWFVPLITDRTQNFVGRADALDKLGRFAESGGKRALVVVAPPGLGKTTLLARWAQQEFVLRHFLRENDEQNCTPAAVFANLARQAAAIYGVPLRSAKGTEWKRWRDELFRILEAVPAHRAAPLVILDGLDEAERARPRGAAKEGILDGLPEAMQLPGRSRWIFSTRPELLQEDRFTDRFATDRAEHLELHRLNEPEVAEFLRVSGHWNVLQTEPRWMTEIARRSEGSPLYLRLLVEELRAGTLLPGNPAVLPVGLTEFFSRTLRFIEESSRASEAHSISLLKRNAEALLRRLVADGLLGREASEAFKKQERQRLDSTAGEASLEVLALLVLARSPMTTEDVASILGRPADELERALVPLRMVLVKSSGDGWSLFHGAFRDFVASTHALSVALAGERLRKWILRYRDHRNPYALRHLVGHLADSLEPGSNGPQPETVAQDLVRALTDLEFIALRASQNDTAGLLADYDLARELWRPSPRAPSPTDQPSPVLEPWLIEVVDDVLSGSLERHSERGSGPVVAALRERVAREDRFDWGMWVERSPYFAQDQTVPEEWFPNPWQPAAAIPPQDPPAVAVLEAFASFVSAHAHLMVAGANVPALAFNSGADGLVAQAAASILRMSAQPWIERKNRLPSRSGTGADVRVLPGAEAVCVSQDFRRFATVSSVRAGNVSGVEARLAGLRTGEEIAVVHGRGFSLRTMLPPASAITGDRLIVGSVVVDFAGKCIYPLVREDLRANALTPDGRMAVIAKGGFQGRDDYISIWDLESRTEVRVIEQDDPEVHALAISADGRVLVVGRHCGDLQIWDVARGKQLLTFAEGLHVRAVAITPDARFVACGGSSDSVWVIDVLEARVLRRFCSPTGQVDAVALTPDGRMVAARGTGGLFCLWDVKTGELAKSFDAPNNHRQLQLAPDASVAVVGSRVFKLGAVLPDPATRPISAALDRTATAVVLGLKDGSVVHEVFGAPRRVAILRREQIDSVSAKLRAVDLSADGRQALVAYDDNEILLVDIETGRHRPVVAEATWKRLADEVNPKKVRDVARMRREDQLPAEQREMLEQHRMVPETYSIRHLVLTPDAKVLVTASEGDALRAWSVASGNCEDAFPLTRIHSFSEGEVECLQPLPDSSGVVFTKFDCSLHLWRFSGGTNKSLILREPTSGGGRRAVTAVSSDGCEVVWAMAGMPLEVRSTVNGSLIRTSRHEVGYVGAVEYLRNGAWLLSLTTDQEETILEVWDANSLLCVANYPLSSGAVKIVAAREDDRFVCCTQDGQFHWLQYHSGGLHAFEG